MLIISELVLRHQFNYLGTGPDLVLDSFFKKVQKSL